MTHSKRGLQPMIETFFYKSVVGGGDVDDSVRYLLVGWVQI